MKRSSQNDDMSQINNFLKTMYEKNQIYLKSRTHLESNDCEKQDK
jgi:hypothetical protein